jgi:hypothetical protein
MMNMMTIRCLALVLWLPLPALADEAALSEAFGQCMSQGETVGDLRLCKGLVHDLCLETSPEKGDGACWQSEHLLWAMDGAFQVRLARDWAAARGVLPQFEVANDAFVAHVAAECAMIAAATEGEAERQAASIACGAGLYAERAIALRLLVQRP